MAAWAKASRKNKISRRGESVRDTECGCDFDPNWLPCHPAPQYFETSKQKQKLVESRSCDVVFVVRTGRSDMFRDRNRIVPPVATPVFTRRLWRQNVTQKMQQGAKPCSFFPHSVELGCASKVTMVHTRRPPRRKAHAPDYFCIRTLTPFLLDRTISGLPSRFMS